MTPTEKITNSPSLALKRVGFNLAARENHADYATLLKAKELFALLAQSTKLSRAALLLKLTKSFALTDNFTHLEQQLVTAAAELEGVSIEEFSRRATLLYAGKILAQQTSAKEGEDAGIVARRKFIVKPKSQADLRVSKIVAEIMLSNDLAACWQDKKEITVRAVNEWGKHASTRVAYKSISQVVLKRYFMLHRAEIKQHHALHNIKPDHNRRAFAAKNKALRELKSKNLI